MYEFNTTDEQGNKIMDKMSKEEMFQAMKEISAQYGDSVLVQFSGDGMAALIESKKVRQTENYPRKKLQPEKLKTRLFKMQSCKTKKKPSITYLLIRECMKMIKRLPPHWKIALMTKRHLSMILSAGISL